MLSLTEGYLSPCPSLSGSLGSLPLPPGNKESLGQITPLRMVTWGLPLVPWLRSGLPTNPGGTPIPTHPTTTLRMWLARTHPPDCPHSHPTPDILLVSPHTFLGLPLWSLPLVSLGFENFPCLAISRAQMVEGFPSLSSSLGLFCHGSQRSPIQKAWCQVTHSPRPFGLARH
jgi:hypothetical protein